MNLLSSRRIRSSSCPSREGASSLSLLQDSTTSPSDIRSLPPSSLSLKPSFPLLQCFSSFPFPSFSSSKYAILSFPPKDLAPPSHPGISGLQASLPGCRDVHRREVTRLSPGRGRDTHVEAFLPTLHYFLLSSLISSSDLLMSTEWCRQDDAGEDLNELAGTNLRSC